MRYGLALTWRLWRALRFPDEGNPVFERVNDQSVELPGQHYLRRLSPVYAVAGTLLPALVVVAAPVALLLGANVLGALIAFNVMRVIQREREGHTYDLLALLPMGLGAVNWQIASACAQRLDAVERLSQFRALAVITLVLLMFYLMRVGAVAAFSLVILFVLLNLDAIQTLILGSISGMLAQSAGETGSPYVALMIFTLIQLAVYVPVTGLAIVLLDPTRMLQYGEETGFVVSALALLALLFLLREAIIRVLWRALERRFL